MATEQRNSLGAPRGTHRARVILTDIEMSDSMLDGEGIDAQAESNVHEEEALANVEAG